MKNRIESSRCRITELFSPIERRQIFGDEIAAISCQILEITRPEIINYSEMRVREFFLQRQRQIRADEPGAAGDDEVVARCGHFGCVIPSACRASVPDAIPSVSQKRPTKADMTAELLI